MFEKILSVLPYNPGMAPQLAFYSRRMREEAVIRRTGMIFMVLAFMVQFFAVLSPPVSTSAGSNNDLINGGVSSIADARAHCIRDTQGYQKIMHNFGISCAAFDKAEKITIKSNGQDYYSAGHLPQGATNNTTGRATNETPFRIEGAGTIYMRKLDSFGTTTYDAMRIRSEQGRVYYILYSCGNLVSVGLPTVEQIATAGQPVYQSAPLPTPVPAPAPTPTPPAPVPTPPAPGPVVPPTPPPVVTTITKPVCKLNPNLPAGTPDDSPLCFAPCEYDATIPAKDTARCKPCEKSTSSVDANACIVVRKTGSNITTGLGDANNSTANPSDVITYTLYAQNTGKADVKDYTFQETLSDVLDYADVQDLAGGVIDANKTVTWPKETIKAGATATHKVTVKIKAEIPATPTGSSDQMHYDLTMTNVYGNAVNIKVPTPALKSVQVAAATLPNTGPGTTLFIATSIVVLAGYFFGRARLLATESDLALKEIANV